MRKPRQRMTIVGPGLLAESLVQETGGNSDCVFLEADIRSSPELYYPEYEALCNRLGARPFPRGIWRDLCAA